MCHLPEPHLPVAPPPDEECERCYDFGVGVGAQSYPGLIGAGLKARYQSCSWVHIHILYAADKNMD